MIKSPDTKKKQGSRMRKWIQWIIITYCAIGIVLYYMQETFLFHPIPLPRNYVFRFPGPFKEIYIPVNKTDTIHMVKFLPVDSSRKGVVLYFHGNRENIERYAPFTTAFTRQGYEVWMPDYPGYGKSSGERTEKKLYELGTQVYTMASSEFSPDSILIYGKSLGTGIASYTGSTSKNRMVILETPYYNIPSLFASYAFIYPTRQMIHYNLPVYEFIQDIKSPVIIFHGTSDGVIPFRNAVKLRSLLKPKDVFIEIKNGGHNNLFEFFTFKKSLDSLLQ